MLDFIEGSIVELGLDYCVLECNGIGYKLVISSNTYKSLIGSERAKIKVYMNVREDAINLFGFYSNDERKLFHLLISVSGIGPKVAMSVLSEFTVEDFLTSIGSEDIKSLQRPAGIGKKSAERILLELKDKVKKEVWEESLVIEPVVAIDPSLSLPMKEAKDGLLALGYSEKEIDRVFEQIDENFRVEEILKLSLKLLSRS